MFVCVCVYAVIAGKADTLGSGTVAGQGATPVSEPAAVSPALARLPEGIQAFMGQQGFEQPTEIQRRSVNHF